MEHLVKASKKFAVFRKPVRPKALMALLFLQIGTALGILFCLYMMAFRDWAF